MEKATKKLNLACGEEYLEGYWNVDNGSFYPGAKTDQICDIKKMDWKINTLDEIRLAHFAMYLRPEEMTTLLEYWFDWLKTGGKLVIETIDVKKVCKIVVESNSIQEINTWGLTNIFGNPVTCPHQWGWSPKTLRDALYKVGFYDIKVTKGLKKPGRDFIITGTK